MQQHCGIHVEMLNRFWVLYFVLGTSVYTLNVGANRWETHPCCLPELRAHHAVVQLDRALYVLGMHQNSHFSEDITTVQIFKANAIPSRPLPPCSFMGPDLSTTHHTLQASVSISLNLHLGIQWD